MGAGQRPLSEVSPMAQRRNSPSWNQSTKQMLKQDQDKPASPRLFWQGRDSPFQKNSENYDPNAPHSPSKRPSLENLKRASRVRNSHMFRDRNPEYDPNHVYVPQRPLVTPKSSQNQENNESDVGPRPPSPSKDQASPTKSSLSRASRFGVKGASFDPPSEIWSDSRNAKSVTFDVAPPQVNEYEMTTPDPSSTTSDSREGSYDSEEEMEDEHDVSFEHESFAEHDDSFDASLEDTDKTPVVMPEDWRYKDEDEDEEYTEDEAEENHSPDPEGSATQEPPKQHSRVESLDSNGEPRPLPPLPSVLRSQGAPSQGKLNTTLELASGGQRSLPTPPAPATVTKEDITEFSNASMSLEDRLRLMMIQDERKDDKPAEHNEHEHHEQHEHPVEQPAEPDIQQKEPVERKEEKEPGENKTNGDDGPQDHEVFSPPRISRDSILADLRKGDSFVDDDSYMDYDPDVPIPSLETDNYSDDYTDDDMNSVVIKEEEDEDEYLYDVPEYHENVHSNESSTKDLSGKLPHDDASHYSFHPGGAVNDHPPVAQDSEDRNSTPVPAERGEESHGEASSDDPKKTEKEPEPPRPSSALGMSAIRDTLQRPATPDQEDEQASEPSTPGSVIRHPIEEDDSDRDSDASVDESVPAPVATIKAPGGLKTRPSLTPADVESMAATRRKVSGPQPHRMASFSNDQAPPVPLVNRPSSSNTHHSAPEAGTQEVNDDPNKLAIPSPNKDTQRQPSLMKLDIPFSIQEESLGFGLDKEFDRVMENQKVAFELALSRCPSYRRFPVAEIKDPFIITSGPMDPKHPSHSHSETSANHRSPIQRGYLMRQNTKVIVASSHNEEETATTPGEAATEARVSRTPGNSNRKPSQQTWTTVPWNSQRRRSSVRAPSGIPKKKPVPGQGSVPPLPGQQSNVQEPAAATDEAEPGLNEALEEGEERGRLFVKVVGIKYLDLPLPRGERSYFTLTLDNGLHCVTTSWLELGKTAPISQEFELIVQNDLEFQLTLQMKVDEEKMRTPEVAPPSPTKQKASTFSRVFASPRKRKELEMKQQMVSQQRKSQDVNAGVWDRLRTTVAQDGSFARSYVSLSDHEKYAFGRPYTVDVACFNEWATEEQPSSVKSKRSTTSTASQRRPPYKIGKLELQLLFVPKPKDAKDDDMPKSMNSCIREMREAESVSSRTWEGFLSQQGGDCPYWRRRFFKLQGSKLTAYHETTRQPRATINLSKAVKLIDDRSSLTQRETSTRGGGRRKSAFAEEEEGYMFVEEGFRIRFGNGEVIDFYADNAADKDGWMKVLADSVGKGPSSSSSQAKPWTELVLKRERSMKTRRQTADNFTSSRGAPPVPAAPAATTKNDANPPSATSAGFAAPAPPPSKPRHKHTQSQPEPRADARRQKTRSLIF